jgi:hypothetical protein
MIESKEDISANDEIADNWILDSDEGKEVCNMCSWLCWALQMATSDCLEGGLSAVSFDTFLQGHLKEIAALDGFCVFASEPTLSPPFNSKTKLHLHPFLLL